jgi:histone H1/5
MAAKKTATKKTSTKSPARKPAAAKTAKSPAAEPATKTKPAAKAPAKKPLKLSDAQGKILRQIEQAGDGGYTPAQKAELRSIEKLRELKLVKAGAKDKTTGTVPYLTTAAGKKHLATTEA